MANACIYLSDLYAALPDKGSGWLREESKIIHKTYEQENRTGETK